MKKAFLSIAIFTIALISTTNSNAQEWAPMDKSPMDLAAFPDNQKNWRDSDKLVKVIYSRPQLKGRSLDKLAPNGKVWRTGANEAAEITFYSNVLFGGKEVEAGTYTLFTIPSNNEWTVILSNQKNIWGSYFYDENEDEERVKAKVKKLSQPVEMFSIVFDGEDDKANMHLGWGNVLVSVPVEKVN